MVRLKSLIPLVSSSSRPVLLCRRWSVSVRPKFCWRFVIIVGSVVWSTIGFAVFGLLRSSRIKCTLFPHVICAFAVQGVGVKSLIR